VFLAKTVTVTTCTLTVPDLIHPGEYMDFGDLKLGINLRELQVEATDRLVLRLVLLIVL